VPTAVDLFAGAGGASVGLASAGFDVVGAVENDRDAANSFALNHVEAHLDRRDIRRVDPAEFMAAIKLDRGALTLLKSCPPCQGFSSLGSQDDEDPRNDLVAQTWRFAQVLRPAAVLVENVPGLQSDARFATMIAQANAAGYWVCTTVVDAVAFGVPQHRKRLIVVAIRGRKPGSVPESLLSLLPADFDTEERTAGPALSAAGPVDGRDSLHRARTPRAATLERIRAVPVGGSRFDLPPEQQLACHQKLGTRSATSSYGRVNADKPAPTMTTRCTTPACGRFIHPTEPRGLTLREAALLQTFPSSYQFSGGYDSVERQIGNAVPTRMAAGLGHIVLAMLRDSKS
jgi:DNA (cytosine-5)-methyltransferase 1